MQQALRIRLENNDGQTVRSFLFQGDEAHVVFRKDKKRLELVPSLQLLEKKKIQFEKIAQIPFSKLANKDFVLDGVGTLKGFLQEAPVLQNVALDEEDDKIFNRSLLATAALAVLLLTTVLVMPKKQGALEQELKQQLVQIVKHIPQQQKHTETPTVQKTEISPTQQTVTKNTNAVKRMGALAVLGSMKSGSQKGGINLGAVQTSAGPGLGGTQGSGGVQTTLYGKGLVAAPLGAGSNLQGAGGYGTKGKGGGQAGYGTLSLVGSAGANPIPVGKEAIVGGGLDRDLIADVINRNLGQVRFCYEQGLQGNPNLSGRVAVDFTIGGNGIVKSAGVENTTLNSKMVEDCIVMRLKSWKFPLPEGGVDVKVSYPFVLRRSGQG